MPLDTQKKTACHTDEASEANLTTLLRIIDQIKTKVPQASWHNIRFQLHDQLPTRPIPDLETLKTAYQAHQDNTWTIDQLCETHDYSKTALASILHALQFTESVTASAKELAIIFSRIFFPHDDDDQSISTQSIRAFTQDQCDDAETALTHFQHAFIKKVQLCLQHPEQLDRIHQWNLDIVFGTEAVQKSAAAAGPKAAAITAPNKRRSALASTDQGERLDPPAAGTPIKRSCSGSLFTKPSGIQRPAKSTSSVLSATKVPGMRFLDELYPQSQKRISLIKAKANLLSLILLLLERDLTLIDITAALSVLFLQDHQQFHFEYDAVMHAYEDHQYSPVTSTPTPSPLMSRLITDLAFFLATDTPLPSSKGPTLLWILAEKCGLTPRELLQQIVGIDPVSPILAHELVPVQTRLKHQPTPVQAEAQIPSFTTTPSLWTHPYIDKLIKIDQAAASNDAKILGALFHPEL